MNYPEDKHIIKLVNSLELLEFPLNKDIELDLGCGKGTFSAELAKRYPEKLILSTDVMLGRLRKLSKKTQRNKLPNITLLRGEAWFLLKQRIANEQIFRIHLLCPDPWPKGKHKGFRLISSEFVALLHKKLRVGGVFHFSTDAVEYFNSTLDVIHNSRLFKKNISAIADIQDLKTDFEHRWNALNLKVYHSAWIKS